MPDGTRPRLGSLRPGSGEWSPDAWEAGGTGGPGLSAQRRRVAALPAGLSRQPMGFLQLCPGPCTRDVTLGTQKAWEGLVASGEGPFAWGLVRLWTSLFEEALQTFPGFLRWLPEARSDHSAGQVTVHPSFPHSSAHRSSWSIHALLALSRP